MNAISRASRRESASSPESAGRLSSRAIALGVRSQGWGRAGLLSFRCDSPAARQAVGGHELPGRTLAIRGREPTRLADVLPDCLAFASWPVGLPVPAIGRAKEEGTRTSERYLGRGATTGPVG